MFESLIANEQNDGSIYKQTLAQPYTGGDDTNMQCRGRDRDRRDMICIYRKWGATYREDDVVMVSGGGAKKIYKRFPCPCLYLCIGID